jgi:hypothetical protein
MTFRRKTTKVLTAYFEWLLENNASLLKQVRRQQEIVTARGLKLDTNAATISILDAKVAKLNVDLAYERDVSATVKADLKHIRLDKWTLMYSHNNSGGYDWVTPKQWQTFAEMGYETDSRFTMHKHVIAKSENEALMQLKREFYQVTGDTGDEPGCSCCGAPHYLRVEEGWTE